MIAWLVASGADRCGQCPVASRVTRAEPGIAWWTKAPTSRGATLEDAGSTSGTWLDGRRIGAPCAIVDNDFTREHDFTAASYRLGALIDLKDIILDVT